MSKIKDETIKKAQIGLNKYENYETEDPVLKIYSKDERLWHNVKDAAEKALEQYEEGIILNKKLIELAENELKSLGSD